LVNSNVKSWNRLSVRIVIIVILFSSLLTLLTTSIQLYFNYQKDVKSIHANILYIEESYLPAIASSIYTVDMDQIKILLDGTLNIIDIEYIEIEDTSNNIIKSAGNPTASRDVINAFPLDYITLAGKKIFLGTLKVYASFEGLYKRLFKEAYISLLSNMLRMFVAALLFLVITNSIIIRHLKKVSNFTQDLNLDELDKELTLDRRNSKSSRFNELDQLVSSLNDMQSRIRDDMFMQKQAAEELRESEDKFRSFFELSVDLVCIADLNGYFKLINPSFQKVLGYSIEELLGRPFLDFIHPDDKDKTLNIINEKLVKGEVVLSFQNRYICKDSSVVWLEWTSRPIVEKQLTFTIARDVTERKKNVEKLRKSEENLSITLNSIGDAVIATDRNGTITRMNPVAEKLTGWKFDEAKQCLLSDVFYIINAHSRQVISNPVEEIISKGEIIGGSDHSVLIAREGVGGEISEYRAPLRNQNGEVIGAVLVFRDITEQHKLEYQLQQAQKMESIGTLAGGIAHDFNNMLGVITGNISFALSSLNRDNELYPILSDIQEGAKQAQNLTLQLLTFSKGGTPVKKVMNINKLVNESAIFSIRGAKATCRFEFFKDLWVAEVDEGQINQVIGNLVINANQAMPNGGMIAIKTENSIIKSDSVLPLAAGHYVKIIIEDQGVGISQKHLQSIFEPYFTTKQKGNGLGLATAYSIIKRHNGFISVYSELEKGTVFNIYLPASVKDVEEPVEIKNSMHKGAGKVLIMDDQESILKMVEMMVKSMGYETVTAVDGIQSIDKFREAYQSDHPFDLVILDLTIPGGMGGVKTVIELLKIDPNVRAVVSSGYSNDSITANYRDYGFCGSVPKPFTMAQLAGMFNEIFDEEVSL